MRTTPSASGPRASHPHHSDDSGQFAGDSIVESGVLPFGHMFEPSRPVRRVVLAAVAELDQRAIAAVCYARQLPAQERSAIHVVVDAHHSQSLGIEWMASPFNDMPLHLIDDIGGIPATVRMAVELNLAQGVEDIVVVIGYLAMPGLGRRLLHDHTAERIQQELATIERSRVALVPVSPAI